MVYTPQTWANDEAGATPISADRLTYMEQGILASSQGALSGAIDSATSGTLVANTAALISASAGNVTRALPTGSPLDAKIVIGKSDSSTGTVTATGKINDISSSSVVCTVPGETVTLLCDGTGGWIQTSGGITAAYDDRYQLSGTAVGEILDEATIATSTSQAYSGTAYVDIAGTPLVIAPVVGSRSISLIANLCVQSLATNTITADFYDQTGSVLLGQGMGATVAGTGFASLHLECTVNPGPGIRVYRVQFKASTGTSALNFYGKNNGINSRFYAIQQ